MLRKTKKERWTKQKEEKQKKNTKEIENKKKAVSPPDYHIAMRQHSSPPLFASLNLPHHGNLTHNTQWGGLYAFAFPGRMLSFAPSHLNRALTRCRADCSASCVPQRLLLICNKKSSLLFFILMGRGWPTRSFNNPAALSID